MPDPASIEASGAPTTKVNTRWFTKKTQDGRLLPFFKKHTTHASSFVSQTEQSGQQYNSKWIGDFKNGPVISEAFKADCDNRLGKRGCWADVSPEDVWKAAKSAIGQTTEFDEGPMPDDDVAGQELRWQHVMDGLVGPDGQFIDTQASQNDLQSAKG